ncbi:hypothetical protein T310_7240 [Rasamsonia emersonii CBS 393.64]|uniref:Methyltransferase domain-containing protein n=1 Tax=Rasamsonia emersonii (strain ATCC 16479 / CBS 393.64 / IMI 116815) TaxID=1408163 RepID=A0A0F4YL21_RASE3|nr:hypothetical protein T310_7240 [Rasamsonia emersonii CBS 393.64]KKA18800.1 hypothetical protein T310_7240 [Rasamsonia emersonii CBS 393.64]
MAPASPLPLADEWQDADSYVDSLLSFATSTHLFINLCGGVHILDFLTREPDLYTTLLPEDWRLFFDRHDVQDILHLLLREDLSQFESSPNDDATAEDVHPQQERTWKGGPLPPRSLLDYIRNIRRLSLRRDVSPQVSSKQRAIPRRIAVGMKTKKLHEVANFSQYVDSLCADVAETRGEPVTHIVDFGSGQNYLGRTLASPPYNRHVIAIERVHDNIREARDMDVHAKLAEKKLVLRNKKEYLKTPIQEFGCISTPFRGSEQKRPWEEEDDVKVINVFSELDLDPDDLSPSPDPRNGIRRERAKDDQIQLTGSMHYIEHEIQDGYLEPIIRHVVQPSSSVDSKAGANSTTVEVTSEDQKANDARVMVVSLHSCGNLIHHGVRSLVLNPSVVAVAMIGCCYNLMTERLGPATWKLPVLRSLHPRLESTGTAYDPHGFPMSKRLAEYPHASGTGIKLNITARMMAVQAPYNWGKEDSEAFFTRHFYRALLQRVLLDHGVVPKPTVPASFEELASGESEQGGPSGTPLIVGSLRKAAYASFPAYVQAALTKLTRDPTHGDKIAKLLQELTTEELEQYVRDYMHAKKNLSVVWSLMAFSAAVVEAIIVVDRWQFLREYIPAGIVKECWVEPVFDYAESPRNLAVIGIKR